MHFYKWLGRIHTKNGKPINANSIEDAVADLREVAEKAIAQRYAMNVAYAA